MAMQQKSDSPTRKVMVAGVAGAASAVVVWVMEVSLGMEVPAEVAVALSTLIGFFAAYFVPPHPGDGIEETL